MELKRVVVTGLGTVNAVARSASSFSAALRAGHCGIGPVSVFDPTEFRSQTGGEVRDFQPRQMLPNSNRWGLQWCLANWSAPQTGCGTIRSGWLA